MSAVCQGAPSHGSFLGRLPNKSGSRSRANYGHTEGFATTMQGIVCIHVLATDSQNGVFLPLSQLPLFTSQWHSLQKSERPQPPDSVRCVTVGMLKKVSNYWNDYCF